MHMRWCSDVSVANDELNFSLVRSEDVVATAQSLFAGLFKVIDHSERGQVASTLYESNFLLP